MSAQLKLMSVGLRSVSVSRSPKNIRFARMWKLNESGLGRIGSADSASISIRQGITAAQVLGAGTAALLSKNNIIGEGLLHLDRLDAFLTDGNLSELKKTGMELRVGNEFDRANTREAIIGRLADERDDYFVSRYEKKHARVSGALKSLVFGDVAAWNEKRRSLSSIEIDLSGADLSGAKLPKVDLRGTRLYGADLSYAKLLNADLSDVDATGAYCWDTDFSHSRLIGTKLPCANLSYARLRSARLMNVDLAGALLPYSNLERADLTDADIRKVDIVGATLGNASLRNARFSDADAGLADFSGVDMTGADLSGTDFGGASLVGAILLKANLAGANLNQAILSEASVSNDQRHSIIANTTIGYSTIVWSD